MMMQRTTDGAPGSRQLTCDPGGWITSRVPRPEIEADAAKLLAASAEPRPNNVRFAIDGRHVYMLGELRDADGLMSLTEAQQRLSATASDRSYAVSSDDIACVLGETGYEWSQPQVDRKQWRAAASNPLGGRCDLTATIVQGGVEVRSLPSAWEADFAETTPAALLRFLATAQGRIRFARFHWQDGRASALSFAAADRLEVELPDSVAAVVTACRLVWQEVPALANARVAEAYLQTMT